jgi:predicted lipoprotein with Yx(FWY)xxD motif
MKRVGGRSLLALLLVGVLALAACGGDDDDGGGAGSADARSATVSTLELAGFGDVVATKDGKPVYMLTSDPQDASACEGACLKDFAPLTEDGTLTAGPGIDGDALSQFDRQGTTQVAYNGHALYTFKGEGLVTGAGMKANGGTWYLIDPDGNAIETTAEGGY